MTEAQLLKFNIMMIKLAELYNQKITEPMLDKYHSTLKNHTILDISGAYHAYVYDSKNLMMPKPAHIINKINQLKSKLMTKNGKRKLNNVTGTLI